MVELRDDLTLALDRVSFARALGIEPDPWQGDFLRSSSDRVLLNCSRQSGKSTTSALLALHRALYHPGSLILCLAPALRQSQELFSKLAGFYRDLGRPIPPLAERRLGLELENGSRVVTLPGTEKTIRGYSGTALLIVDEAARVEDGLYGVFFEEWTEGVGWERYEVAASRVPRISKAFLEEERRALPARIFHQEYECSFEETDDQVFSYEDVTAAISDEVPPLFGGSAT